MDRELIILSTKLNFPAETEKARSEAEKPFMTAAAHGDVSGTLEAFRRIDRFHLGNWTKNHLHNTKNHLHLKEPLTLVGLADLCHISPNYLFSLFRKETGQSLIDYINERRIRTASERLIYADEPISSIAPQVGILDVNYFTQLFKKIMGVTPAEYQKNRHQYL